MNSEGLQIIFDRYKGFAIRLAVIIVFMAIALGGIKTTIEEIFAKTQENTQARERLHTLQTKENLLKGESTRDLLTQANRLTSTVPSVIDLPQIVAILQEVATETNVTFGGFSITPDAQAITILSVGKTEKLSSFQFKVNLSGSFEDVQTFIDKLSNVSPMFRGQKLTFTDNHADLIIHFYFQPTFLQEKSQVNLPLQPFTDIHKNAITAVMQLATPGHGESTESAVSVPIEERKNPFQ